MVGRLKEKEIPADWTSSQTLSSTDKKRKKEKGTKEKMSLNQLHTSFLWG